MLKKIYASDKMLENVHHYVVRVLFCTLDFMVAALHLPRADRPGWPVRS